MRNYQRTIPRRTRYRGEWIRSEFVILLVVIALFAVLLGATVSRLTSALANDSSDNLIGVEQDRSHLGMPLQNTDESWMLVLVNADNPLPNNYAPPLKSLADGFLFDERAVSQLDAMLAAARAEGLSPLLCSTYRSIEAQKTLFKEEVSGLVSTGFSKERADAEARKQVAFPGTSEHNLGLAADIVSSEYQLLDEAQANTPEFQWLLAHCAEYGFILRYPNDKTEITGIIYEPWHFRYVGVEAATEIMLGGLCLEEYLAGKS